MPFSLLFSVDSRLHTLFACCLTISARIVHADYPQPLRGIFVATMRISAAIMQLSVSDRAAVRTEQPRNSAKKVKFSVSRTVVPTRQLTVFEHSHAHCTAYNMSCVMKSFVFNGIVRMSLLILAVQPVLGTGVYL